MRFEIGNPGGPGRPPKIRPEKFAGVRITREDITAMKDGAVLLRLAATWPGDRERYRRAAASIERMVAQWEARRHKKNAQEAARRADLALGE